MLNLSKSRYVQYCQCPKLLWLAQNKPDEGMDDPKATSRLENGRLVGNLAKKYFGEYKEATILYPNTDNLNLTAMIRRTKDLMDAGTPVIVEAAFSHNDCYCAVDLLRKEGNGWCIYEVKSTTADADNGELDEKRVLAEHVIDIAYQRWVLEQCGVNVVGTHLLSLNRQYVLDGELDIQQLFVDQDFAEEIAEPYTQVPQLVEEAKIMLHGDEPVIEAPSENCSKACAFWKYCTRHLPQPNVFSIMGMQYRSAMKSYREGFVSFQELLNKPKLNENYKKVVEAELNDVDFIDCAAIRRFLDTISYPLYHLDFETMQLPIPEYQGTRPYQQIPFQYSLHIQKEPCGPVEHKEFLAISGENPLRPIAEALVRDIPKEACGMAYNKAFEQTRLKELANMFPDLAEHLLSICNGIVDLDIPFRQKSYYTKAMQGSYSIKYVLPALFPNDPDLDYHRLEDVHNGGEAMTIFPKIQFMAPDEQKRVRTNLLKYCGLDTYAMVKVLGKLYEVAK